MKYTYVRKEDFASRPLLDDLCVKLGKLWEVSPRYKVQHSEEGLKKIQLAIRQKKYRFKPMFRSYIPKTRGRRRPIAQPASFDRLLLIGLLLVLTDLFNPHFHTSSHGFRPGLGCRSFFISLCSWGNLKSLQKSDIVSCFDRIPHRPLLGRLHLWLGPENPEIMALLRSFLRTPILEKSGQNVASHSVGLPQGSPISPLLMNIYLHSLDVQMGEHILAWNFYYLRYADDIILGFGENADIQGIYQGLKGLGLEVTKETVSRREQTSSAGMRILGLIFRISRNGQLRARPPFKKWNQKAHCIFTKPKRPQDPNTIINFTAAWHSMATHYLPHVFGCPGATRDREILSYFRGFYRREGLSWIRRNHPKDKRNLTLHREMNDQGLVALVRSKIGRKDIKHPKRGPTPTTKPRGQ